MAAQGQRRRAGRRGGRRARGVQPAEQAAAPCQPGPRKRSPPSSADAPPQGPGGPSLQTPSLGSFHYPQTQAQDMRERALGGVGAGSSLLEAKGWRRRREADAPPAYPPQLLQRSVCKPPGLRRSTGQGRAAEPTLRALSCDSWSDGAVRDTGRGDLPCLVQAGAPGTESPEKPAPRGIRPLSFLLYF